MKASALFILSLAAGLAVSSCAGFLDRDPESFITLDDIKVEEDLVNVLNGAYSALIINKELPLSLDFITDNGYCNDPIVGESVYWRFAQTPSDMYLTLKKWSQDYAGILRANTVITKAPELRYSNNSHEDVTNGEARRACHIAEAKVLRAFFYMDLIDFYGDCPWRTKPEGLEEKKSPRVDRDIILSNILLDLDESIDKLPLVRSDANYGRLTQGAALAVKARLCLYNGLYEWCADACRAIIALGQYALHPLFSQLFTETYERNSEYIFTQQYIPDKTAESASGVFWSKFSQSSRYMPSYNFAEDFYMTDGRKWDDPGSSFSWAKPYDGRDPRLEMSVVVAASGKTLGISHTGMKLKKFIEENPEKLHNNDGMDFPLIRYADVLLMLAESLVETNHYDYDEVCSLVNKVRQRSDVMMPTIAQAEEKFTGGPLSRERLLEAIRHERRVELGFEGLRMSDIRRWKIGPETMTDCYSLFLYTIEGSTKKTYKKVSIAKREFDTVKGYLWPIPAIEVQTNPMENNPGYYD